MEYNENEWKDQIHESVKGHLPRIQLVGENVRNLGKISI